MHQPYVSASDVGRFWKQGYLKIPSLLDKTEVTALQSAMNSAVATMGESPNAYDLTSAADQVWSAAERIDDQGSVQHDLEALAKAVRASGRPRLLDHANVSHRGKFLLDTSVWRRTPELARFAQCSKLPKIAATLLASETLRFYDDQLFVKEPGAIDRAAFHQDLSYFHLSGDVGCVFWIPLTKVRRGGGCMGYVPGSHRWNKIFNPNIFASSMAFPGSAGEDMPDIEADPDKFGTTYLEADPGDVIVHHFTTIHGSEGNGTCTPRAAFSLRYCDADIQFQRRAGAPNQPLHRREMRDGERLDDVVHPIVLTIR